MNDIIYIPHLNELTYDEMLNMTPYDLLKYAIVYLSKPIITDESLSANKLSHILTVLLCIQVAMEGKRDVQS